MVHAAFADEAPPLVCHGLERVFRHLENDNLAAAEFNFLGINGNAWFGRRGNLVLVIAQPFAAKLMRRRIAVIVHANDDEAARRFGERTSRLYALDSKRLLQLESLHLMLPNNAFKFFARHFFLLSPSSSLKFIGILYHSFRSTNHYTPLSIHFFTLGCC